MNRWIPTKPRTFPSTSGRYLIRIINKGHGCMSEKIVDYDHDARKWCICVDLEYWTVTHYVRLPDSILVVR
jgi:hypothetical protein